MLRRLRTVDGWEKGAAWALMVEMARTMRSGFFMAGRVMLCVNEGQEG